MMFNSSRRTVEYPTDELNADQINCNAQKIVELVSGNYFVAIRELFGSIMRSDG